ncbi:MAG: RICIN domain-containing protein [Polyangiales bacterium]
MHRAQWLGMIFVLAGCSAGGGDDIEEDRGAQSIDTGAIYEIEAKHSGKVVDVDHSQTSDGVNIQQWSHNGTAAQRFRFEPAGDGFYVIRATVSGKVLDVQDKSMNEGANVQQWSYWGGTNQQWKLEDSGGGYYYVRARHSGKYLDVAWGSKNDGANIAVVNHYDGSDAQRWKLIAVSGSTPSPSTPSTPSTLPTRLRVTNHCAQPLWIAHSDNVPDPQNQRLENGQSVDFHIPDGGLSATRFWPKTGCDGGGHNCAIGDSGEGGGKPCPASGCQPPVDSKFEASFAARGSGAQTWYNLSQVDGYTLPFKVTPHGTGANSGSCVASDCGALSLDKCPGAENMSGGGKFPAFANEDLRVRDASGRTIACMAPCKKWNYPAPWGLGRSEAEDPGLHMCCPTPIDPASGACTVDNHCMTSPACSNAADPVSVVHTSYVAALRSMCPSAYSYAYDDAAGLHACSPETSFEVTFCP